MARRLAKNSLGGDQSPLVAERQSTCAAFAAHVPALAITGGERKWSPTRSAKPADREFIYMSLCRHAVSEIKSGNFTLWRRQIFLRITAQVRHHALGLATGGYQRLPRQPHRRPPPRSSLTMSSSTTAPIVAFTIAGTSPAPR